MSGGGKNRYEESREEAFHAALIVASRGPNFSPRMHAEKRDWVIQNFFALNLPYLQKHTSTPRALLRTPGYSHFRR